MPHRRPSADVDIAEHLDDREDWEIAWERVGRKPAITIPSWQPMLDRLPDWLRPTPPLIFGDCESSEFGVYE